MASIGHLAIGISAARLASGGAKPSWWSMVAWSALSMLPDVDVIGSNFGIAYEHPFGHRGASHSLLVATAVGAVAGLFATAFGLSRVRLWFMVTAVLASHGLLDTLTDGGLGCALLWPFDATRFFAPWRPIPVAPLGFDFFSQYGAFVGAVELILFSPLAFFALRRDGANHSGSRGNRWAFLSVWAVAVWLIGSTDRLRQAVFSVILRSHTEYGSTFSEQSFAAISPGMTPDDVTRLVGAPLEEWWQYPPKVDGDCRVVRLAHGVVVRWQHFDRCTPDGVRPEMASGDVRRLLGSPPEAIWQYSRSPSGRWFQARNVFFWRGKVEETVRRWSPSGSRSPTP